MTFEEDFEKTFPSFFIEKDVWLDKEFKEMVCSMEAVIEHTIDKQRVKEIYENIMISLQEEATTKHNTELVSSIYAKVMKDVAQCFQGYDINLED